MLCERLWTKDSVSITGLISAMARSSACGLTKPSRLNMPFAGKIGAAPGDQIESRRVTGLVEGIAVEIEDVAHW